MTYNPLKFKIDLGKCISCKACCNVCEAGAFHIAGDGQAIFDDDIGCILCGGCESIVEDCPVGAICKVDA